MAADTVLDIIAQGAWNGGRLVDNSIYENKGMTFKGGIPVNNQTIEKRIGVRTRTVAPENERIGVLAFKELLQTCDIDPARIKLIIGATNIGEDKLDPGPLVRHSFDLVKSSCPDTRVLDLYAGCPGFNVSVELVFIMSLAGFLQAGDLSIIVGAENVHRARVFAPDDTANIIFGDDAVATALETKSHISKTDGDDLPEKVTFNAGDDIAGCIAGELLKIKGPHKIDGIIMDNQLGMLEHRIPAMAARIQHCFVEQSYPEAAAKGTFKNFRKALAFYNQHVNAFAFDVMTVDRQPDHIAQIANAYTTSGKYKTIASIFLGADRDVVLRLHRGQGHFSQAPKWGIVDTLTQSHGCFAPYIEVLPFTDRAKMFGHMNGKGVFLHATRGAKYHLETLMAPHNLDLDDIDLLIEHQANFAMIPLTLEQVLAGSKADAKQAAADFIAAKMVTNIHARGNCSVVCMQRLPYDLERDALQPDTIQGYAVNQNLDSLRQAKTILYDSIGAGMTRSSFLQRKE